jgi:hypothetical protein
MKIILFILIFSSCYCPEPKVQSIQRFKYDYHFTVDGTDSTLRYTIYTSDSVMIAADILASQLDSVINVDNE